MRSAERRQCYRRTRRTAAGVACVALVTFVATDPASPMAGAPAQESFNNGTGSALAFGYKVNPVNGGLSFGITAGESVAGHQNTGATGQARAINLGVIGVTLAGEGCDGGDPTLAEEDQPQPVIARSGEDGAAEGFSETESGAIEKFARATTAPFAEAITTILPSGDPAAVYVSGGRTISHSGVIDGNTREALARTEIDALTIGGGAVKVRGLTWEAIHRSGAVEETIGTFTIDGLVVGGQAVTLPSDDLDQLEALKDVLEPLGLSIKAPKVRVEQDIVFVSPLEIAVVPSQTRDGVVGPLIGEAQPLRDALTKALLDVDCGNASYITIADLVLGSVTGAGQVGVEVGGVQATTAEINGFEFELLPTLPPVVPDLPTGGAAPPIGAGGASPTSAASPEETAATDPLPEAVATPISSLTGERGGVMALIAGGGLLLLLASAEADRRKMRSALRAIPLEA
jgi:hypothetical protein